MPRKTSLKYGTQQQAVYVPAQSASNSLLYEVNSGAVPTPYEVISQERPNKKHPRHWWTEIRGPFMAVVHVGTCQTCGPETVRMLNLAYNAGRRKGHQEMCCQLHPKKNPCPDQQKNSP